jgi:hypothetical protein
VAELQHSVRRRNHRARCGGNIDCLNSGRLIGCTQKNRGASSPIDATDPERPSSTQAVRYVVADDNVIVGIVGVVMIESRAAKVQVVAQKPYVKPTFIKGPLLASMTAGQKSVSGIARVL